MVCYHYTPEKAWAPFQMIGKSFIPFRDAGVDHNSFECTILDCLKGLYKAMSMCWYNFSKFDYKEYEFNHRLENGDMNWIIPKRILALSSPSDCKGDGLPPAHFIPKFKKMKVTAIIRLNEALYDESQFRKEGIEVYNLEYMDGSYPNDVSFLLLAKSYV